MEWALRTLSLGRTTSRFLELPQEIRDLIYQHALTSTKPMVSFRLDDYQRQSYQEAIQPPLTKVSRQVRKECLPIFYDCNNIILHTEATKSDDTRRWLSCLESRLTMLNRLSIWFRHVTLTNDVRSSNGAIAISLQRRKPDGIWMVDDRWHWVTVAKMPSIVQRDAKFLISEARRLLNVAPSYAESADGFVGLLTDLKLFYVREKMS